MSDEKITAITGITGRGRFVLDQMAAMQRDGMTRAEALAEINRMLDEMPEA